jgi:hypothetical protein
LIFDMICVTYITFFPEAGKVRMNSPFVAIVIAVLSVASFGCSQGGTSSEIVATVLRAETPDPYNFAFVLRVDSLSVLEGGGGELKVGDQVRTLPNFIYISPHVMDMSSKTNQHLMELAKVREGEKLRATIGLTKNGEWLLIDGRKL